MTSARKSAFSSRPSTPDAWVRAPDQPAVRDNPFTARLTIDVTPVLRGRIKVTAFERGQTVAEMIRALLEREFSGDTGERP
jgi:hypothetical protein